MRLRNAVLGATLLACVHVSAPGAASAGAGYAIVPGDLLEIVSYDDERLNGRKRVSPEGSVALPFVGDVRVAGMTPAEATRVIAGRLGEYLPAGRSLTVQVFEHAPVFVVGDVDRPGAQPFRPGMVVLELVALAGGEWRPPTARDQMTVVQLEQEIADQRLRRFALRAQLARLDAEMRGASYEGSLVPRDPFVSARDAEDILAAEARLHEATTERYAAARRALEAQRDSFDVEIETLGESIALHDEEVALLAGEAESIAQLVRRGLAVQTRESALRRELSAARRDALDLRLALARARQAQLALSQRIADLDGERRSTNALAVATLELEAARIEQRLAGAATALAEGRSAAAADDMRRALVTRYFVIREDGGEKRELAVDELAGIRPGDILRVNRAPGFGRLEGRAEGAGPGERG